MKRILIAFLSVFFANVALADNLLHINSNIVGEIVKKHIPPTKQFQALFEYNQIVKERGGITPDEIRRVCAAAGWQTDFAHAMTDGAKCDAFVEDLLKNASVKFYEVCGKDKSGGKCINDFQALTTNMIQATGLAKLYAYHKDKTEKVVCSNTARTETTNNTSTIRGGMNAGMAPTTSTTTHYVQCKSLDKNIFYEFKFNNTRGTSDSTNHRSFKTGICSVFGYKFQGATKKDNREKSGWDICDGATQNACGMINNALSKAHSGYFASWGPLGRTLSTGKRGKVNEAGAGYELSNSQLPYCILTANAGIKYDGTAYERTAFGLDGRYFLSKDIQTQGTAELHEYIRKYVVSRGVQIQEFSCAETYVTVQLKGRSDPDDMITCTINGSTVDFFFDNLSEGKDKYIQGAKQALDCMVSGGTFTGKKCIGLGKEQCEVVRAANAMSCPECKQIKWNSETNICELPASASASKLKRGLNYTAIVGGAVVGIVITVGTLGTSSAPTIAILGGVGIETAGSVIELIAQMRIDEKADKFFTQSANCKNQTCAEKLIKDYLQELANQSDSLLDSELTTADEEFARLFDLIPPDAEFYTKIVENGIRGETVESNKRGTFEKGSWNSDQIWRAVGIGLQIIPTVASVGWKIAKKSDKLVKSTTKLQNKLELASKHIDNLLNIRKTNSIINAMSVKAVSKVKDNGHVAVFKFIDDISGQTYYLKHTDELEEIIRTQRAYEILNGKSDIVHTVRVFEDNQNILNNFAKNHGLSTSSGKYWFLIEEMPGSQTALELTRNSSSALHTVLGGKPVTIAEQEEILKAIDDLNANGIVHGDLHSNMFFTREPNGKLRVDIIDYEPWSAQQAINGQDRKNVEYMFDSMRKSGLAENPEKVFSTVSKTKDKKLETAAKQLDELLTIKETKNKNLLDLLDKYDIDAIPNDQKELEELFREYPDLFQAYTDDYKLSQQIKQFRYENPGLWTPGEDVANYYDVENLQKKLKVFKDEEDDYISELQKRYDELSKETRGKKAYTEETWKEIGSLRAERNALLQTYDDEITQLSDELSDLLIKQQAINDGSQQQIVEQIRQVEQKRAQVIQAKQASASTNPRVIEIDKRLAELDTTYKPEAVELINEKYYIEELISDAKKTVGDKQNMVWWEAIPQEIKDKYVQYMDDTMLKTLAEDPNLALYVRNWDVVKNDERLYAEFLNDIEVKLNSDIFPQGKGVSIQTYYNPFTGQQGATNGQGAIRMNTHYYLGEDVEETIGTVKHEILGHHIDAVMPNYGLQGTTMQNAVPNFGYELNDTKRILSHGNTDANIITAKSPILGTEFSISDASEDVQHALRKDGWKVRETMDKDTYERYLGEITEREAHSITPTSNVQDKVEAWYYQKWKK